MGRDPTELTTPDLFSTDQVRDLIKEGRERAVARQASGADVRRESEKKAHARPIAGMGDEGSYFCAA
jgi:hypothetical protein